MSNWLCISVHNLSNGIHARVDGQTPEWPPSPLRLLQALVAGAAGSWNERQAIQAAREALEWLERQPPPLIVASEAVISDVRCQVYVPDNTADLVVPAWKRGDTDKAVRRSEKVVRSTHLPDHSRLIYGYRFPDDASPNLPMLARAARAMTHLGWGIDMVAGDATVQSNEDFDALCRDSRLCCWQPTTDDHKGALLRVPRPGTLDELCRRHQAFLHRVGPDGFRPVPPPGCFAIQAYRRSDDPPALRSVAFALLRPDAEGFRLFNVARGTKNVAGMVRSAVARLAETMRPFGWDQATINQFVHGKTADGKGPANGHLSHHRFSYLPLPTINFRLNRVEAIRRILITAPAECLEALQWVRRSLAGAELTNDEGEISGLLTIEPSDNPVVKSYLSEARTWSTVTPVLLPGHDDHSASKAERLLRKAFEQAGFSRSLVDQIDLEFRRVGYFAGTLRSKDYTTPENLARYPRYHVKVSFPRPILGPITIGSGRYRGFGLFARIDN